ATRRICRRPSLEPTRRCTRVAAGDSPPTPGIIRAREIEPPVTPPAAPQSTRRPALTLALLYTTLYLAFGGHLPYWPAWLIDQGLSAATMGSVLGAGFLLRLVVAPVSTAFAGR